MSERRLTLGVCTVAVKGIRESGQVKRVDGKAAATAAREAVLHVRAPAPRFFGGHLNELSFVRLAFFVRRSAGAQPVLCACNPIWRAREAVSDRAGLWARQQAGSSIACLRPPTRRRRRGRQSAQRTKKTRQTDRETRSR